MTPSEKLALDRVQFEQNELRQRLDALVKQMTEFKDEAMRLLKEMGGSIVAPAGPEPTRPEVAPVLHPAPTSVSESITLPETSVEQSSPLPEAPKLGASAPEIDEWMKNLIDGRCGQCLNTGIRTMCGKKLPCICPNGRALHAEIEIPELNLSVGMTTGSRR